MPALPPFPQLSLARSGCALPGVRGAAAEAAGSGQAGQRWVAPSPSLQPVAPRFSPVSSSLSFSPPPPDTLYFFGDNNFTEWGPLFQQYVPPPFGIPGTSPAYSFGIAGGCWQRWARAQLGGGGGLPSTNSPPTHTPPAVGSGSGVPFHWHGPGYSEVIFGRKVRIEPWGGGERKKDPNEQPPNLGKPPWG